MFTYNLNVMRRLYSENKGRKATLFPNMTQKTFKYFRDTFVRKHVGSEGNTWGAQSAFIELATKVMMAATDGHNLDEAISNILESVQDKKARLTLADNLSEIANRLYDAEFSDDA